MFNIFTLSFFGIALGMVIAMIITRQKTDSDLPRIPIEEDADRDVKNVRPLELADLFRLGEKLCVENNLTVKQTIQISESEVYWVAESMNEFFFGNYVLAFHKVKPGSYLSLPTLFEFKDFVKGAGSSKGFFFSTGFFTRDVYQPLEGPKVTLYNRLKVLDEMKKHQLSYS